MLEQCLELLDRERHGRLRLHLDKALHAEPLAFPDDHKAHPATTMHQLRMSRVERLEVLEVVQAARNAGTTTSGTSGRGLAGFVEAWREYVDFAEPRDADPL